eukprot:2487353-Pleurochrysis_carterae.AAC.4
MPRHLAPYVRLSSSIVPAYATLLLAADALIVLLRPLCSTSYTLLRKPTRSQSQYRHRVAQNTTSSAILRPSRRRWTRHSAPPPRYSLKLACAQRSLHSS